MTDGIARADLDDMWQGVNHVTLVTPDLDATLAFYHDVLGMRVLAASGLLALAAALIAPGQSTRGESRWRQQIHALRRRIHPHSWRPGHR